MPSLPQRSTDPRARAAGITAARSRYQFDHSFAGYALVKDVPEEAHFDAGYMANGAKNLLEITANHGAAKFTSWASSEAGAIGETLKRWFSRNDPEAMARAHAEADEAMAGHTEKRHGLSVDQFAALYPVLPTPLSAAHWENDWFFAWQRIAGCNPILLRRCDRPLDHFPITDAHLQRTLADDTLAAAMAERRFYIVDFAMMADVPTGQTDGRQKYLAAPIAAFVRSRGGDLVSVAIQCGQAPSPETPIYTPADGFAWRMAKTAVQVADANFQGIVSHLGYCHLVMESIIIAGERELAPEHPLKILLTPHAEFTLAANDVAKRTLIGPGGNTDRLQSGTIEGSTALVQRCLASYAFCRTDAPTAFADRGVDDLEGLPVYPFRDDALESFAPLRQFAGAYVALYYQSAEDVAEDVELQAWVRAIGDREQGNLHQVVGSRGLQTTDDVADFVARVLYTATTFHSAINYASWDHLAFPPNMPAAAWGPGPAPSLPSTEEALLNMMSPLDITFATIKLMFTIMMTRNHLGQYDKHTFADKRVEPLVATLASQLAVAEEAIENRNRTRRLPYTYLLPSLIPASIHV